MKDLRPRSVKRANRKNNPQFGETLGGAMPLPATDAIPATYVAIWLAFAVVAITLVSLILISLLNNRPISPETAPPGGAVIPLNSTLDASRVQQARSLATPADVLSAGQQTGVPAVPSAAPSSGDTYMLQGSVGTNAAR